MSYTSKLLKEKGMAHSGCEGNGAFRAASRRDQLIANDGQNVHKIRAKDSTGRWAYYFLHVPHHRERLFREALKGRETVNLEDYGEVLASNYGKEPTDAVRAALKERFGWDIPKSGGGSDD